MRSAAFIGLDLAGKVDGNHSGIAVLVGDVQQVKLGAVCKGVDSLAGVVDFIQRHAVATTVVAVDAPLVVRNRNGQRLCETLISSTFGRFHASCHTTNLGRPYARTGMTIVDALAGCNFVHKFDIASAQQRHGRWVFEVYPHPAMIRLFGLKQIIKFKKGTVAEKRVGLHILRGHLKELEGLEDNTLLRELLGRDLETLKGKRLKQYEDTLDALFCAYLAWHCWRWGAQRNEVFGTLAHGYIVVPKQAARRGPDG